MTQKHRSISLIVIHCSATRVTQDFTFEQLEACHLARGFKSIGYHYYITKDGVVYPGRPESEVGAHARHYNAHSIGICYEGGLDKNGKPADTRTPAQNQALYSLLESLCLSYPDADIITLGFWSKLISLDASPVVANFSPSNVSGLIPCLIRLIASSSKHSYVFLPNIEVDLIARGLSRYTSKCLSISFLSLICLI